MEYPQPDGVELSPLTDAAEHFLERVPFSPAEGSWIFRKHYRWLHLWLVARTAPVERLTDINHRAMMCGAESSTSVWWSVGKLGKTAISAVLLGVAVWFAARDFDSKAIWTAAAHFDSATVSVVMLAILGSTLIAALRLRTIAGDFGFPLSVREAAATLALGQVGGFLGFQIFGQLLARGAYLKKRNVPVSGTVLITAHERIGSAAVSLGFAICGALYLFHQITLDLVGGGTEHIKLIAGLCLAVAATAFLWRNELRAIAMGSSRIATARLGRAAAFSAAVQLAMMAAYVVAGRSLAPNTSLPALVAASTLVMFAASIPVSFAGWGVRELSAVAALGAIGLPADLALAIAVLVGLISLLCAGVFLLVSVEKSPSAATFDRPGASEKRNLDGALANVLPPLVATFIFFQVRVPIESGQVSVNLADPLALLGATMFLVAARNGTAPKWRVPQLPLMLLACTLSLALALLIGAHAIGWTDWAVGNKFLGWFILLSYGMTGALALRLSLEKVLHSFAVVGSAIVLYQLFLIVAGLPPPLDAGRFPGFAQNSNAFAFQCVLVLAAALSLERPSRIVVFIALAGTWLTMSRAGVAAAVVVVLGAAIYSGFAGRLVRSATAFAAALTVALFGAGAMYAACRMSDGPGSIFCGFTGVYSYAVASSNAEHLLTMLKALDLFRSNPVFGAGLGVFYEQTISNGRHIVVHSTPLWLLAEFGIVGAAVFSLPFLSALWSEARRRTRDVPANVIVLSILGFGVMSLAHELMYQRAIWFLLGAALAAPLSSPAGQSPTQDATS